MIDVGEMRHRVTWSKQAITAEGGKDKASWQDVGTYWAKCEPLRPFAAFLAQQQASGTSYQITMRNVGPIQPEDRLRFEPTGRIFEVVGVYREMEQNTYLIISANELFL